MKKIIYTALGVLMAMGLVTSAPSATYAQQPELYQTTPSRPEDRQNTQTQQDARPGMRAQVEDRLADKRLQACQDREGKIKSSMLHISSLGQRHSARFMTITERVQAFYVKQGKELATYDQLVNEVNSKKAAAEAAVQAVKDSAENFSCTSDNPKEILQDFRTKVRAQNEAMKQLRTAIKNLIVGVKSIQGTESRTGEKADE